MKDHVKDLLGKDENKNLIKLTNQPRNSPGTQSGGDGSGSGEAFSVDADGYMTLGRQLTTQEQRLAEKSGMTPRAWEDRHARMLKGQQDNEAAKKDMIAKGITKQPLPGQIVFNNS